MTPFEINHRNYKFWTIMQGSTHEYKTKSVNSQYYIHKQHAGFLLIFDCEFLLKSKTPILIDATI